MKEQTVIGRFAKQRILVIGDVMLDHYVSGPAERLSTEAPVPVVKVTSERYLPGGAANVAMNLRALGADVTLIGAVGFDKSAQELRFNLRGIEIGLVQVPGLMTTVKTRVIAGHQQVVRCDREDYVELTPESLHKIGKIIRVENPTGIVLSDYDKGMICQPVVDMALAKAKELGIPIGLDPKRRALRLSGLTVVTPNVKEAYKLTGLASRALQGCQRLPPTLLELEAELVNKFGTNILLTMGEDGMEVVRPNLDPVHLPTKAVQVYDVSGAGDTVMAATILSLAAGADILTAAKIANHAAGIVVGKAGAAICNQAELLESFKRDR